jgi:hypothetical protein
MVAPLTVSVVPASEKVGVAPQPVRFALGVLATCKPVGRLSVKPTPVKGTVFPTGAVSVNFIVLVSPTRIVLGVNVFVIVGGATTVNVADALLPVPPLVALTEPLVLPLSPLVALVTLTKTVQEPLGMIDPPDNEMVPEPVAPLTAPPHWAASGGEAIVIPDGKVSEKATPVKEMAFVDGFVMVNVNKDVLPIPIVLGENALEICGATTA